MKIIINTMNNIYFNISCRFIDDDELEFYTPLLVFEFPINDDVIFFIFFIIELFELFVLELI